MFTIFVQVLEGDIITVRENVPADFVSACIAEAEKNYPDARAIWEESIEDQRDAMQARIIDALRWAGEYEPMEELEDWEV